MKDRFNGRADANDGKDFSGRQIVQGDRVVRAVAAGKSALLEYRTVSRVVGFDIYLGPIEDDYSWRKSETKINFSGRLLVIDEK
jgi:hypothetical protein